MTVPILRNGAWVYRAGMRIDGDGAPTCYAPVNSGLIALDNILNAKNSTGWVGVLTDNGKPDGNPLIQGPDDAAPGYYITDTALQDHRFSTAQQRRYVDASTVPYVSVPKDIAAPDGFAGADHIHMGDLAVVLIGGRLTGAIVADAGPRAKYGEASIACAKALSIPASPRNGGVDAAIVTYVVFRGSLADPPWPRDLGDIQAQSFALFEAWGGAAMAAQVLS